MMKFAFLSSRSARIGLFLLVFTMAALGSWGIVAWAAPGSFDDPLVTQAWAEDYINSRFAPLEAQLEQIQQNAKSTIILTIGSAQALVNNRTVEIPAPPQIMGAGYTMVPARFIGEALGLNVVWDPVTRQVSFSGSGRNVVLTIDKTTANINGAAYAMPYPPVIAGGHTLVHARFVSEAFQCQVDWNPDTRRVTIIR